MCTPTKIGIISFYSIPLWTFLTDSSTSGYPEANLRVHAAFVVWFHSSCHSLNVTSRSCQAAFWWLLIRSWLRACTPWFCAALQPIGEPLQVPILARMLFVINFNVILYRLGSRNTYIFFRYLNIIIFVLSIGNIYTCMWFNIRTNFLYFIIHVVELKSVN